MTKQQKNIIFAGNLNINSLAMNLIKSLGLTPILVSILSKKCFGVLCKSLMYLFQLSLKKGVFPDDLEIVNVASMVMLVMIVI